VWLRPPLVQMRGVKEVFVILNINQHQTTNKIEKHTRKQSQDKQPPLLVQRKQF